ncbi:MULTISPECIES: TetR/AcrR family transcriptional regulator [Sphingobacterium]|uniref:TetR/AcrR family transcriptional regulator n=1 Tax=Sphingobacterium populi TaxID=1812824 RepID=A0ABW5UAZ6_9SPHI|nr:TetR/AcrR family transcriptional regulator [Sphingobacterium sp. CFCC 11742]
MKETVLSRKDRIIQTATSLFANKGFADTSTKEISLQAGVSEALIFKHFGNKDRLLSFIIKTGYSRVVMHHKGMLTYRGAKEFLRNMILLPNKLVAEEPLFWKMQERLSHDELSRMQHEHFIKPVQPIILKAFQELGYAKPELETQYLLLIIDMLWKKEACGELQNAEELTQLIEDKYQLI